MGERVCEPFWRSEAPAVFRHGLTYSGHATACAVAHANLDILERDQLVARVAQLEPVLGESLATLAGHPQVAEIRGPVGLMAGVRLRNAAAAESASRQAAERELLVRAVSEGTLGICPPFVIDADELQTLGARLRGVLDLIDV